MDRAGRVVLPKVLRDQLGLEPDEELEVAVDGGGIRLQPHTKPTRSIDVVDGWPVIAPAGTRSITDADVRELRDADQR